MASGHNALYFFFKRLGNLATLTAKDHTHILIELGQNKTSNLPNFERSNFKPHKMSQLDIPKVLSVMTL